MLDAAPPPDDNSRNCCGDEDAAHPDCHLSKRDQPIQRLMYPHVVPNGTPSKSTVRRNHENRWNHQQESVSYGFTCTARQNASQDNSCDQWEELNCPPPNWDGSPFWEAWNNHPAVDELGTPPSGDAHERECQRLGSICFHRCFSVSRSISVIAMSLHVGVRLTNSRWAAAFFGGGLGSSGCNLGEIARVETNNTVTTRKETSRGKP